MLKSPLEAYAHCLICGADIKHQSDNILKCSKCNYTHYVNSAPAAGALVVNNQNQYLLTKRGIEPYKGAWDVAGGFIGLGETFEAAIARELEEELHIHCTVNQIIGSAYLTYPMQGIDLPVLAFVGIANLNGQEIKVDDDVADFDFFNLEELVEIEMPYKQLETLIRNFASEQIKLQSTKNI